MLWKFVLILTRSRSIDCLAALKISFVSFSHGKEKRKEKNGGTKLHCERKQICFCDETVKRIAAQRGRGNIDKLLKHQTMFKTYFYVQRRWDNKVGRGPFKKIFLRQKQISLDLPFFPLCESHPFVIDEHFVCSILKTTKWSWKSGEPNVFLIFDSVI